MASVDDSVPTAVLALAELLRVLLLSAMAEGTAVSTVMVNPADAMLSLPAVSVTLAVIVWLAELNVDEVMLQLPEPSDVVVPNTVVPSVSYKVTVLLAVAVPLKTGVVLLVMLSELDAPESVPLVMSGALGAVGAVVAST